MTCQDADRDLIAYAEGDLNDVRTEAVRGHVEGCPRCRGEVQAIRRTLNLADAYRIPPLSAGAGVRMLAGVREQVGRGRPSRRIFRLAPALGAAALLALAVVGVRYRTPAVAPQAGREVEGGPVGADRIALLSNDPEIFDAVMERLSDLNGGGADPRGARKGDMRTETGPGVSERPMEAPPLWREYFFPGVKVEALLKDLSDEEMEQVLRKIEERLAV